LPALDQLQPNNNKNEYYITDTLAIFRKAGRRVGAVTAVQPEDIYGINSRRDLALVNQVMRDRILGRLLEDGVTIVDPASTWIDARATFGRDTTVYPFAVIEGPARIGANCRIGPFAHLRGEDVVADGQTITNTCVPARRGG
jgi:bifunctional UDP-N-acetylglucosamine pyrophosphorylase/glucosamine-1-phosphate N-acetyltransferase